MTTPFEVLFSVTLYRDGSIAVGGKPKSGTLQSTLPEILRMIALSIEDGSTVLNEEGEPV